MTEEELLTRITNDFSHHPPNTERQIMHENLRAKFRQLALSLPAYCPPSRELSLALTNLEQALFWANAAIARNQRNDDKS